MNRNIESFDTPSDVNAFRGRNQRIATYIGLALIPLSGFAVDIYIPSLPKMGEALHAANAQVQQTISIFLISYGVSQLFIGSILDGLGRYKVGLWALVIFSLSCIVIANTQSIYVIFAMRIVHGVSVAAIVVAKRAFFVDLYQGEALKKYLSIFTIIWSVGPILAPFFGGYLESTFGWQSNFYFLAIYALLIALMDFIFSGETLKFPSPFNLKSVAGIYWRMLRTTRFTLGLLTLGLSYSIFMVYNLTGPFIIENYFQFSPVAAGYCSLILGTAWMLGGFIGKATIERPFYKKLFINLFLQIIFISLMFVSLTFVSDVFTLVFFAFIIHVTAGYNYNNYFTYSLSQFPKNAGIAGGLSGGVSYITVSFLSYGIVYLIPARDETHLAYSYLILIVMLSLIMFYTYRLNKKQNAVTKVSV